MFNVQYELNISTQLRLIFEQSCFFEMYIMPKAEVGPLSPEQVSLAHQHTVRLLLISQKIKMDGTSIPFSIGTTEPKLTAQFFSNKSDNQMKLSDTKLAYATS